jgi:diaminopimelate decarboxylase
MKTEELKTIAVRYGTPCFVFDLEAVKNRVRAMQEITGGSFRLCYSIKANPFLIPAMGEVLDHLEVCSPGELTICESLHVKPETIVYSGVSKTPADIAEAIDYGVGIFTAESIHQLELVSETAVKKNADVPVLLRLSSGSQFGMAKEDIHYILSHPELYPNTRIEGLHYFVGTQRKKLDQQRKELQMLKEFFEELRSTYGLPLEKLEYGPGLGVPLFEGDDFSDTLSPLKELADDLKAVTEWAQLTVESGRFIATECGTYLTKVMDTKHTSGTSYAILDGGINHVNYLGAMMGMKHPLLERFACGENQNDVQDWCLCGSLCTTNDILIRKISFDSLAPGDILAFRNIGAYSVTEGIHLFLSRTMPRIVLRDGEGQYRLGRDYIETSRLNTLQSY